MASRGSSARHCIALATALTSIAACASSNGTEKREPCFEGAIVGGTLRIRVARYITTSSPCEGFSGAFDVGRSFQAFVTKTAIKDASQEVADHCESLVLDLSIAEFAFSPYPGFLESGGTTGSASSMANFTYRNTCKGQLYLDLGPSVPKSRFTIPARDVPVLLQIRFTPLSDGSYDPSCPPVCGTAFDADVDAL